MDRVKNARRIVRATVTKTLNSTAAELAKDNPDVVRLKMFQRRLEENSKHLVTLNTQMMEKLLDVDTPAEELDAESDDVEIYAEDVEVMKIKLEEILQPTPRIPSPTPSITSFTSVSEGGGKKTFKLPKIELKKFSGELTEWLGWWAQFKKIDEDVELHPTDKFQYLIQSLVPGTQARALADRYPQSEENYPKVIEALKDRFGKEKLLRQVYIRELIKMIINKGQDSNSGKISLSQLYDKLDSHLRSLESLGPAIDPKEFLFPMVESSLPKEILVAWQRSPFHKKESGNGNEERSELDNLLMFLKEEIDNEKQRVLAESGFGLYASEKKKEANHKKKCSAEYDVPTAAGLFNGDSRSLCIFCDNKHESKDCRRAIRMSIEEKNSKIQKKRACYTCLKVGHHSKICKTNVRCLFCGKRHHTLMRRGKPEERAKPLNPTAQEFVSTTMSSLNCTKEVILQTLVVKLKDENTGRTKTVRALMDIGSQRSYVLRRTVNKLGIRSTEKVTLNHMLFGGSHMTKQVHNLIEVGLHSMDGKYRVSMRLLDQEQICGVIPRLANGPWLSELLEKGIVVNDLNADYPTEIEVLIGADNFGRLQTGRVVQLSNGLTATETCFGWTLIGKIHPEETTIAMNVISMSVMTNSVSELWKLESIGIHGPVETKSKEEKEYAAKKHFMETIKRDEEGRYSVSLPWIEGMQNLPENKSVAEKRLVSCTKKLNTCGKYNDYEDIFKAWEGENIIENCHEEVDPSVPVFGHHYLPHRAVFKPESKTTPVRPVFDASCKIGRSPSLNDCLEKGPNLLELIPFILLRFRIGRFGIISDIRKAFLMIEVNEEDRNFLRFLWWGDTEQKQLKMYRHNRVVFGMNCSPFLLGAVIEYHLNQVQGKSQEIAQKLLKALYVDNCVTFVATTQEYEKFRIVSTELMNTAKMELRQWEFTRDNCGDQVTSVLGLKWNKFEDELYCGDIGEGVPEKVTKRVILSRVQKIFDPIGFLCPAVLSPKLMLQRLWSEKNTWDEDLSTECKSEFQKWCCEISEILDKVGIPRNCTNGAELKENFQIHTFCDASKQAYAAVVYLRVESEGGVSVQMLQAKSRVAPMKIATIPRLELLSCTIASRLISLVKESLQCPEIPIFFWSDSSTALAWIKRNDDWGTFVGNRVREICSLTDSQNWRHVPGILNPADLPSRGCSPLKLLESKWWEGPDRLKRSKNEWPSGDGVLNEEEILRERKKVTVTTMTNQISVENSWWITKHSSYIKNVRVVAMVLRAVEKFKRKSGANDIQPTQEEVSQAEICIFKMIQQQSFPMNERVISGLKIDVDQDGLIHVKKKLVHRQDTKGFRYPVLLPSVHPVVEKLIREEHKVNCHAGAQFLMGNLREKVWIVHGRRTIKKVLNSCVTCRRFSSEKPSVPTAPLPEDRVKNAKAFEVTGVDLAGPLILKDKTKCWFVIFTCAVYRGVHLELLESMSAADFLSALIRFVNRKRRPSIIYSDNGTNFHGSNNLFKQIDWKEVTQNTKKERIQWKFNPPSAPWWGGWWERLIRSVKDQLKRMLGFGKLTYVQLETCLCEVEAVINDRPLTFVTDDQEDLVPLTPAMFFHDMTYSETPEAELLTIEGLQRKYRDMSKLFEELKSRFRREYLAQLVQRGNDKKRDPIKVGDVVLIADDNKKRIEWSMARVLQLMPGKDGEVRVAKVKTSTGELTRPLQRLYPLEVSSSPESSAPIPIEVKETELQKKSKQLYKKAMEVRTRHGRIVKAPVRFGH